MPRRSRLAAAIRRSAREGDEVTPTNGVRPITTISKAVKGKTIVVVWGT